MGSLLLELVPFALGLAVTPTAIATCVLFLGSRRPVANASAFAAPFVVVYTGLSAAVQAAMEAASEPLVSEQAKHAVSLTVGVLLLVLATRSVTRHPRPLAQRQHSWLSRLDEAGPVEASTVGLVLSVLNPNVPILLAGLATVAAADVGTWGRMTALGFLVASSVAGMVALTLWYVARPGPAAKGLTRLKGWLKQHERAVNVSVLIAFGAAFTVKGIAGL